MAKIGIVGTGYVGLVSAVCFAKLGHSVNAYDLDEEKIGLLKSSVSPIYEEGLTELLVQMLDNNYLRFTSRLVDLADSEFVFLCVPTPQDQDGSADLSYVLSAAVLLKDILPLQSCLITKSTVPVKSWKLIEETLERNDVYIVSNPEFLREGSAISDFFNPDRIVVGCKNFKKAKEVADLYKNFDAQTLITDNTTAELIKYASNSFLALKLSYVNDIAALCEKVEADTLEVLRGMGLDKRIGENFTTPGPGWGGSCFPKDVRALMMTSEAASTPIPLLSAAWESNERAHRRFVEIANDFLGGSLVGKKIAIWGLAFKAFTDDVRESPSLAIIDRLVGRGASVIAYDPKVKNLEKYTKIKLVDSLHETVEDSDLIMVLTEWPEFAAVDPTVLREKCNTKKIIDGRGILSTKQWRDAGFEIWGIRA